MTTTPSRYPHLPTLHEARQNRTALADASEALPEPRECFEAEMRARGFTETQRHAVWLALDAGGPQGLTVCHTVPPVA